MERGPAQEDWVMVGGLPVEWGLEPTGSFERRSGSFSQEEAQGNTGLCCTGWGKWG